MARKSRRNPPVAEVSAPKAPVYATVGYTRISKDGEKSEDSMENQAAIIRDWVKDKPDIDLRKVIDADEGRTGADFDRPGYAELMAGIKDGSTRCVVVKDLSRLGRDYIEVGELLFDTLVSLNVRFISVNDDYDSFADDAGRKKLLILFKNLVNHMYSRDLGKKIRSAYDAKKRRGEPVGYTPYGYRISADGKKLVIEPAEAGIAKRVFDMRAAGLSLKAMAKQLNREGVPSPRKRRWLSSEIPNGKFAGEQLWDTSTLGNLLRKEVYVGSLVQNKYRCEGKRHVFLPEEQWIRHENTHEAIVSRDLFDAVQKLMDAAAEKYRKTGKPMPENPYAGKLFCSRCGKKIQTCGGIGIHVKYRYACRRCRDELNECAIRVPSISHKRLDAALAETLRVQTELLDDCDGLVEEALRSDVLNRKRAALARDRTKIEKEIADAERTTEAAYIHCLDGLLDFREYELVRERARRKKDAAAARLAFVDGELQKTKNLKNNPWREKFGAFRDFDAPTKELVQALVRRITITPLSNAIDIELNYTDAFAELRNLIEESGVIVDA